MVQEDDHAEFQAKLGAYSVGALDDVDWLLVRTHVAECERCRAELARPELPHRPARHRAAPAPRAVQRPGWPLVIGTAAVSALIAFGVGYALGVTG